MVRHRLSIKKRHYKIVTPKQLEPFKNVKGVSGDIFKSISHLQIIWLNLLRAKYIVDNLYADRQFIWGLDLSYSNTGISIYDVANNRMNIWSIKAHDRMVAKYLRAESLARQIVDWYSIYPPIIAVIEPYGYYDAKYSKHSEVLYLLHGSVKQKLSEMGGCILIQPTPKQLKYIVTGEQNKTSKLDLGAILQSKFQYQTDDLDRVDAAGFALVGKYYWNIIQAFSYDWKETNVDVLMQMIKTFLQSVDNNIELLNAILRHIALPEVELFDLIKPIQYYLFLRRAKMVDRIEMGGNGENSI